MALEKEAHVLSGELQLKSFGQFIEHYDNQLAKLGLIATFAHCCTDNILQITKNQYAPITINYDAGSERVSVFPLIDSDDHNLNKVLIVFAKLCEDVQELDKESHKYQYRLFFFDEELMEVEENGNAQLYLLKISQMLDFLFECKYFLQRCLLICSNLFQQLVALLDEDVLGCKNVLPINFNTLVDHFVLLLQQFAIFDEIITSSSVLKHWSFFKKSIHFANQNASAFSKYSENDLCGLENVVNDLEIMFMGHLFQNVIDIIGNIKEQTKPKIIGVLAGLFQNYIKSQLAEICKYDSDLSDLTQTPNVIRINLLCVCYHKVFGSLETKSLKQLIECNNKHCSITLIGNIIWCPEAFIFKHAETLVKSCDRYCNNANNVRRIYLHNRMQSLPKVVYDYCVQVVDWISKLNAFSISSDINLEELRSRCLHILKGTKLAGQINHLIKSVTNLHVLLKISVPKSGLHLIAKLIELLKLTHNAFVENSDIISETINYSIQHLQYQALFLIASAKKKIGKDVMSIEKNLSTILALQIAEKLLYGPATTKRLLVVRLALSTSDSAQLFSGDHLVKFLKIMRRLEILGEQQKNVEFVCDTSFMYWHQSIYGIAIKNIFDQHCMVTQIARITHSAIDHYQALGASSASQFLPIIQFTKAINQTLNEEIIVKICQRIETQLRLDFHIGNLQLDVNNPFTTKREDFRELVHLNPLCIIGRHIAIKDHIEHYLSNMFYNLTTVSLHDWRTYGIMRQLASNKFNLTTVEDHLPTQTLEQGLDVLEIMRNINVFVAKYMYNLNNQIFIERSSNNKHLNTINIRHIANSLRTHGTGIINTTVNYTYQFLRKKFYIFSQFMYDEHIKSRLMKDLKYFRDNKDHLNQMYDFERADNFNKLIRQLGISPNGESYMDLFRQLISQIGNAMGYIRMMRSGAINSCSNASIYLPVLDEQLGFSNRVSESSLLEEALHAAVNLESSYHNLTQEMTESSHYFKLMIDAFAPFFQNADNIHLRNFFLIIPPLTINYVEYIQTSKDKMTKKNKDGALFTDDGFAIGLAFILKLLNQTNDFNSLHWFKSINNKFKKERDALKKEITNISSTTDGKLQQTAHLTEKRITRIQMEFDLLFFNLGSAKIFFQ